MLPATPWRSRPTVAAGPVGDSPLPVPEFRLLFGSRLNLMLAGTQSALEAAIVTLTPQLERPIWTWSEGLSLHLPLEPTGTLVLREVGRLNRDEQQQLAHWLDITAPGNIQVIATTSEPLLALVERREFLDLLYYRLNILRLEVTNEGGLAFKG